MKKDDLPLLLCETQASWETWLEKHHTNPEGVWLMIAKKNTGKHSVSYAEALDSALCFGWIDGQMQAHDADYYLQRFTPRRAKSMWSKINTEKVAKLQAAGRMKPAGLAQIEAAKQDGRWQAAYESQSRAALPEDFMAALKKSAKAKAFFDTLTNSNKYAMYFRIHNAKKPETRHARITKFIEMLENHEKIY